MGVSFGEIGSEAQYESVRVLYIFLLNLDLSFNDSLIDKVWSKIYSNEDIVTFVLDVSADICYPIWSSP